MCTCSNPQYGHQYRRIPTSKWHEKCSFPKLCQFTDHLIPLGDLTPTPIPVTAVKLYKRWRVKMVEVWSIYHHPKAKATWIVTQPNPDKQSNNAEPTLSPCSLLGNLRSHSSMFTLLQPHFNAVTSSKKVQVHVRCVGGCCHNNHTILSNATRGSVNNKQHLKSDLFTQVTTAHKMDFCVIMRPWSVNKA